MLVLSILLAAVAILGGGGWVYSRFLARRIGEDPSRLTPAVERPDGRDFVPTPTPVVFAHHFAAIAGAGPIVGPVVAMIYGWMPALLWVIFGGVLIGAVHDYLAVYIATREGGQSMATIARKMIGNDAFVALTLFIIVMLALVCAAFLNYSATALVSRLPYDRMQMDPSQTLFRVEGGKVVIGGIASIERDRHHRIRPAGRLDVHQAQDRGVVLLAGGCRRLRRKHRRRALFSGCHCLLT